MANQIPDWVRPRRRRRRRRRNGRQQLNVRLYRVREFVVAYAVAILVSVAGFIVLKLWFLPFYVLVGVLLTRYISQRVLWNYYIASLSDVARAKMHTWITWPISLPVLIWQIVVVQHL
jgi:hypothetical protein